MKLEDGRYVAAGRWWLHHGRWNVRIFVNPDQRCWGIQQDGFSRANGLCAFGLGRLLLVAWHTWDEDGN